MGTALYERRRPALRSELDRELLRADMQKIRMLNNAKHALTNGHVHLRHHFERLNRAPNGNLLKVFGLLTLETRVANRRSEISSNYADERGSDCRRSSHRLSMNGSVQSPENDDATE